MFAQRWDRRHAPLTLVVVALLMTASPTAGAQDADEPAVTAAVQVSSNPDPVRAHSSPQIATNPKTGEIVVVESDIQGAREHQSGTRGCNVHISVDDGRSWFPGGDPTLEPFTECSRVVINGPYATLTFDDDGVLYMAFTASDPKWANPHPPLSIPRHVFLARSTDSGRSFETTTVFKGPEEAADVAGELDQSGLNGRGMVAVDPSDPSRVYVSWFQGGSSEQRSRSLIAASNDGGRTFGEPVELSDERGGSQPRVAVGPEGVVHAVYPAGTFGLPTPEPPSQPLPRPFVYRRSTDGGQSWGDAEEIAEGVGANRKLLLVADPNSEALYAVWYGNREKEEADITKSDYLDVFLLASRDGGDSWGETVVVNEGAKNTEGIKRYDPGLSVAPDGRVDIAWYDFRNSPVPEGLGPYDFNAGGFQDVYYTWSDDKGQTFHRPDVRMTDRIMDRNVGVWSNNVHSHTNVGIASGDDAAYVAWQDTRNSDPATDAEDVYFAAARLGDLEAAAEEDGPPDWALLLSALVVGMGVAAVVLLALQRQARGR